MPYKKGKGSLSFLGKAASFLGVLSCTVVLLWQGSVIHAGEGEQCALFNFGFAGNFTYYERQSLAKHTGAGLKAAGFLLPLACFQPQPPPSLLFSVAFCSILSVVQGKSFQVWSNPVSCPGASSYLAGAGNPARPAGTRAGPRLSQRCDSAVERAVWGPEDHDIHVLPLPLHPVRLRLFPLDYPLKSILMDFLRVTFFFFFLSSLTPFPPLFSNTFHFWWHDSLPAPLPCIKALSYHRTVIYTISPACFS